MKQGYTFALDTITTSVIFANILNSDRVITILNKNNVHLDYYQNVFFPVIDMSNRGSLQIVLANVQNYTVTVYRSKNSKMGSRPG